MADNVIKEFLVSLGFKTNDFDKFNDNITLAQAKAVALGEAMYDTARAVAKAVVDIAASGDKLYWQSKNLGSSAGDIKSLGYAFGQLGGSAADAGAAMQSIANFNQSYGAGARGFLTRLGVDPKDIGDSAKTLVDLEHIFQRMARSGPNGMARANAVAGFLGISSDQLRIMLRDTGEFEQHIKDFTRGLGLSFDEAAGKSNELMTTLREKKEEIGIIFSYAELKILEAALPLLSELTRGVAEFSKSTDAANIGLPILVGLVGAAGAAAVIATAPYIALAAAIAAVTLAFQDWQRLQNMTADQRKGFEARGAQIRQQAMEAFNTKEDISLAERVARASGVIAGGFAERATGDPGMYGGKAGSARPGATGALGHVSGFEFLKRSGFTGEQANGILAGIKAEGGGVNAVNPTSGAFGIGQWLGARKAALFAKYGPNPNLTQQMQFLVWELRGGDKGGKSVMRQSTAYDTMVSYLRDFMRPQGKNNEHIRDLYADIRRGNAALPAGQRGQPVLQQTNTYHITGTDARAIGDTVQDRQEHANQKMLASTSVYQW